MKVLLPFLLSVASSFAQDAIEAAQSARQVRLELLIVRLPERRALALQSDLRDPKRANRGQQTLLDLIEKDQAELVDWPIARTLPGNRVVTENITEVRYPIEFAQPRVIESPVSPDAVVVSQPVAPEAAESKAEAAKAKDGGKDTPALLAGIPTNFETRNAGITLEAEPVISPDGKSINIQLAPQHVQFNGLRRKTVEAPGQYRVSVEQPEFQTKKVSAGVTLTSGDPYLFHFSKLKNPAGFVEIWMLTATVETTALDSPSGRKPDGAGNGKLKAE